MSYRDALVKVKNSVENKVVEIELSESEDSDEDKTEPSTAKQTKPGQHQTAMSAKSVWIEVKGKQKKKKKQIQNQPVSKRATHKTSEEHAAFTSSEAESMVETSDDEEKRPQNKKNGKYQTRQNSVMKALDSFFACLTENLQTDDSNREEFQKIVKTFRQQMLNYTMTIEDS